MSQGLARDELEAFAVRAQHHWAPLVSKLQKVYGERPTWRTISSVSDRFAFTLGEAEAQNSEHSMRDAQLRVPGTPKPTSSGPAFTSISSHRVCVACAIVWTTLQI